MSNTKINVGCLPMFLIFIVITIFSFQVAKGKSWGKSFALFNAVFYWIGVGYMFLVVGFNISNEIKPKPRPKLPSNDKEIINKKKMTSNNEFTSFPIIMGILTAIVVFFVLIPIVSGGVFSMSPLGIFFIMGPFTIAVIAGFIVASVFKFFVNFFK